MKPRFFISILFVLTASFSSAADLGKDCASCHNDQGMAQEKNSGGSLSRFFAGGREELSLFVKDEDFKGTPHEGFSCVDCHLDIKELPHAEKLAPVACGACHDDSMTALKAGAHSQDGPNKASVPTCTNCHGAHKIYPKNSPDSSVSPKNLPAVCGSCHGDSEKMEKLGVKIANPVKNYTNSNHGHAVEKGNNEAAVCSSCHGYHDIFKSSRAKSPINRINVPDTCGKCHAEIRDQFWQSIHGTALESGIAEAPTCTSCHSEHDIEGPDRPGSTVNPAVVAEKTCAPCHSSVSLSSKFGIPSDRIDTFKGSFHGLSKKLGDTRVANCASCHGVHNIFPSSDSRSTIYKGNLASTCGKCHPGANDAFANTQVHLSVTASESKILLFIKRFYILIIIGTLGGMFFHNLLDYIRRYLETVKKLRLAQNFMRMSVSERWQHFALFTSFFVLVFTGFALKYPDSFIGYPFRIIPKGSEMRSLVHRMAAIVMIVASVYHMFFLVLTKRGRSLMMDMIPKLKDARDAIDQMSYYLGFRKEPANFDRFNYAEKMEYLSLIWGTFVMVATGFVLWFKNFFIDVLPDWGYPASEMVHFYEAILATFAIIIWHLYAVFSHTKYPPFNTTLLTGNMTREELEHQHPRWLDRLEKEEQDKRAKDEGKS